MGHFDARTTSGGHTVQIRPGGEWIDVTLADGRSERFLTTFGEFETYVPLPHMIPESARPFAEAIAEAMGGKVIQDGWRQGHEWYRLLKVILGTNPLPPMSLAESDPYDEDD
jgi:hypothetical protein